MSDPTQERILALLEDLSARMSNVEQQLAGLQQAQEQLPNALATTVDTVDAHIARLQQQGVDVDQRLNTTLQLVERLTRPETAAQLQQALDLAEQAPGAIAGMVDTLDAHMAGLQTQGVDIDQRMAAGLKLAEAATRPESAAALASLMERVELLEQGAAMASQVPGMAAMALDTVDQHIGALQAKGVDVDARARKSLELLERLTRPETMANLEQALVLAETAPGAVAGMVDTIDQHFAQLYSQGIDLDERIRSLTRASEMLTRPELLDMMCTFLAHSETISQVVTDLLSSGVLEPEPVRVVGSAGKALAETTTSHQLAPMGLLALARSANDPDVNRALVFGLSVARSFGRRLAESQPSN